MRIDNHVIIRSELVLDVSNCVERSFRDLFDLNERGKPIYLLKSSFINAESATTGCVSI